jgi:hypothetical protein
LLPEIGDHFGWSEVEQAELATWVAVGGAIIALAIGPLVDKLAGGWASSLPSVEPPFARC